MNWIAWLRVGIVAFLISPIAHGATVTTDKADYQSGDVVFITGAGWQAGENVELTLDENPRVSAEVRQWIVMADANGQITDSSFQVNDSHYGVTFTLRATGQTSGLTAQTQFTDSHTVSTISPNTGPSTGGTVVTISGSGFLNSQEPWMVTFGSTTVAAIRNNNNTLTTTNPPGPVGPVNVTVTGVDGHSVTVTNGFTYCQIPVITNQPSSQAVCQGASVSFMVGASGTGLTFRWRLGAALLTNGGNISGADTATLTISPVQPTNAGSYSVIITNSCGSVTSSVATLTVSTNTVPTITCPSNVTVQCYSNVPPPNTNSVMASPGSSVSFQGDTAMTNGCQIVITRTYAASNQCGTNTCSQTITVNDTNPPQSCISQPAGMISWWPGDGNTSDIRDSNNGTAPNGVAFVSGKVGQAFSFNGANQYVSAGNPANLKLTSAITIDAWVRPNDFSGDLRAIVSKWGQNFLSCGPGTGADSYGLYLQKVGSIIQLFGVIHLTSLSEPVLVGGTIPTGSYSHVAMTYESSTGVFAIYVNGVVVNSVTNAPLPLCTSEKNVLIGAEDAGPSRFFTGSIDEVEIFSRALSPGEIQQIFQAGSFGKCKPVTTNTAPGQCSQVVNYPVEFMDNCGATLICSPTNGSIFPVGTNTVTCVISDSCNSVTNSFTVTVTDKQPPQITCGTNRNVECGTAWNFDPPTAMDNCDGTNVTIQIVSTTTNTSGFCGNTFSATRTWAAIDTAFNTNTCSQTITVQDTTPPMITCQTNRVLQCPTELPPCQTNLAEFIADGGMASDNCDTNLSYFCTTDQFTDFCLNIIIRTHTVVDSCNNSNECVQFFIVDDKTPPTITCPSNLVLSCSSNVPPCPTNLAQFIAQGGMVSDNCSTSFVFSCSQIATNTLCGQTILRTISVIDPCNNSNGCVQVITITDNEPPQSCATVPPNIVSWWPAEGNANDIADSNHGTLQNGATASATGKVGTAFSFDGVNDYVLVPDSDNLDLNQALTIDAWIFVTSDATSATNTYGIVGKYRSLAGGFRAYELYVEMQKLVFRATAQGDSANLQLDSTSNVPFDQWVHVAVTLDSTQSSLYINGQLEDADTGLSSIQTNDVPLVIGTREAATTPFFYFKGFIDEVEIFSRALSQAEIVSIYAADSFGKCHSIVTNAAPGQCSQVVNYQVEAVDNCSDVTTNCSPASGSSFPAGITTVTCIFTDACTNYFTNSFTITVVDDQPPTLMCPTNLVFGTDPGQCSKSNVTYPVIATDNCDTNVSVMCAPPAGTTLPVGTNMVTCVATDDSGNTNQCSFTVTVMDTEPPQITCGTNRVVECGTTWDFDPPTATDNCDGSNVTIQVVSTVTNMSGFCGNTFSATRIWAAIDSSSNSNTCSQTITVVDTTPPQSCVTAPTNMVSWWPAEGNANDIQDGNHGTLVNGTTFAAGKVGQAFSFDGMNDRVDVPFSPSLNLTGTELTLEAWINPANNVNGTIYLGRTQLSDHPYMIFFATGGIRVALRAGGTQAEHNTGYIPATNTWTHIALVYNGATIKFYANGVEVFSTNKTGNLDSSTLPFSIGNRPINTVPISFEGLIDEVELLSRALSQAELAAIYAAGSFGKCKPVTTNAAPGQCSQVVNYQVEAVDTCSAVMTNCSPASGSSFPAGTTTVTCIFTDACSNSFTNSFTVTVIDDQPPTLMCPTNLVFGNDMGQCSKSNVTYMIVATDNCDTNVAVMCTPPEGSTFPVGTNMVTCMATDDSGNTNTCSFTVTVIDNEPPVIMCPSNVVMNCQQMPPPGSTNGQFCTYGQGGWGARPEGNNPGTILSNNFTTVYPGGFVEVGIPGPAGFSMQFTSAFAIETYLPAMAMPNVLTNDYVNPTNTSAGVFGGQVLALQLNVDFSDAGITQGSGGPFGNLIYNDMSSPFFGFTVRQILAVANQALGGSPITNGVTISDLNMLVTLLNESFEDCTPSAWAQMNLVAPGQNVQAFIGTGMATAMDNCDTNVMITFTDTNLPPSCTGGMVIARTWTAIDSAGNSNSCVQIIASGDFAPPMITCPSNITVQCVSSVPPCPTNLAQFMTLGGMASDECDTNLSFTCSDSALIGGPCGGTIIRTYTVTDDCTNSAQCIQIITVRDTIPPMITCPTNITVQCLSSIPPCPGTLAQFLAQGGMAMDNCDTNLTFTCSDSPLIGGPCGGTIFRTNTVTDDCTNRAQCVQVITVRDTTPPTISCPTNIIVQCSNTVPACPGTLAQFMAQGGVAMDNCDTNLTYMCSDSAMMGNTIIRSHTVIDDCTNSATCYQTITINTNCPKVLCVDEADFDEDCGHGEDTHGLWLPGAGDGYDFTPGPGIFTEYPDGTATLTGTVVNRDDPSKGFTITFNFSGLTTNPPPGSPKKELCEEAYEEEGGPVDTDTWRYYTTFTGILNGTGTYTGAIITVTRMGPAFQVGFGASGKNTNFGASAWFTWTVVQQPATGYLPKTGTGDINVDLFDCAKTNKTNVVSHPCHLHYGFDEVSGTNCMDSSGYGHHGFLINGPFRTNGMTGRALRFDGSNDRVCTSNAYSLNITGAFTVAAWVKPESISGSRQILIKGTSSSGKFAYGLRAYDAKLQYRWISPSGSECRFQTTTNVFKVGKWTHVAAAHTPGRAPQLFVNGVAVPGSLSSGSASALIRSSSNPFTVGSSYDGTERYQGCIDEVYVFPGAFTATQLQGITNGTPPGPPPALMIASTSPLLSGRAGILYSQSLVATGGTPAYTWSLASGLLPAGLTLNTNTGVISGTPGGAIDGAFRIRVADRAGQWDEKNFTLMITNPPPPVLITASALPVGTKGSPYNQVFTVSNGLPPFTWSVINGALPPGLALNPNTGVISGTPTNSVTNTFRVQVEDFIGQTGEKDFTLPIGPGAVHLLVFKFEELSGSTALDSSGNTNHGVLLNGPVRTNGMVGRALRFDGSNDRVVISNSTSLNITGALSAGCWIRPESVSGSRQLLVKGKQSSSGYSFALRAYDARIQYRWITPSGSECRYQTTANVLTSGRWTHVAVVHKPGSLPILYVNGVAVAGSLASGSASALIRPSSNPFTVGSSSDGNERFFGRIDEVFVCAGALAAAEVKELTNGVPAGTTVSPSPTPAPVAAKQALGSVVTTLKLAVKSNKVTLTWNAKPGLGYKVQYKDRLNDPKWKDFGDEIIANDDLVTFSEGLGKSPQRFYRVLAQPK